MPVVRSSPAGVRRGAGSEVELSVLRCRLPRGGAEAGSPGRPIRQTIPGSTRTGHPRPILPPRLNPDRRPPGVPPGPGNRPTRSDRGPPTRRLAVLGLRRPGRCGGRGPHRRRPRGPDARRLRLRAVTPIRPPTSPSASPRRQDCRRRRSPPRHRGRRSPPSRRRPRRRPSRPSTSRRPRPHPVASTPPPTTLAASTATPRRAPSATIATPVARGVAGSLDRGRPAHDGPDRGEVGSPRSRWSRGSRRAGPASSSGRASSRPMPT